MGIYDDAFDEAVYSIFKNLYKHKNNLTMGTPKTVSQETLDQITACLPMFTDMLEMNDPKLLQDLISDMVNGTYKFIITVDAGCGNTSAAVSSLVNPITNQVIEWSVPYYDSDQQKTTYKPQISIPTILGYDYHDSPVLGPDALDYGRVVENFKCVPTQTNLQKNYEGLGGNGISVPLSKIWIDYFREVITHAFTYAKNLLGIAYEKMDWSNVLIVVARPASEAWKNNIDNYRELIYESVKNLVVAPQQILTFSEAKAAMQYVRTKNRITLNWQKGVLVIDLGASTIDVEFMGYQQDDQQDALHEYSIEVAGRDVDCMLGHDLLTNLDGSALAKLRANQLPDDNFFEDHQAQFESEKGKFSFSIRGHKEELCTLNYNRTPGNYVSENVDVGFCNMNWTVGYLTNMLSQTKFPAPYPLKLRQFVFGNTDMKAMAVNDSWYGHLTTLTHFMFRQLRSRIPDTVIVTGGTANLLGIREAIEKGFEAANLGSQNFPQLIILNDPNDYENTVPFGSLSYMQTVIRNIPHILKAPETVLPKAKKDFLNFAPDMIVKQVVPVIMQKVTDILDAWVNLPNGAQGTSAADLQANLKAIQFTGRAYFDAIRDAKANIQAAMQDTAKLPNTMGEVREILKACSGKETYNHNIRFKNVRLNIGQGILSQAVQEGMPDIAGTCMGFIAALKIFFKGTGVALSQKDRKKVKANFDNNIATVMENTIKGALKKALTDHLEKEFDNSAGFGMTDDMIVDLMTDLKQAMFLG